MHVRAKIAGVAAGIVAALTALAVAFSGAPSTPRGLTQGTGKVDVFVGGTPTATATATATATPTANFWVDPSATTGCARAGTAAVYSAATDCTFDQASDLCQNSDTVRVRTGSYSTVTFTGNTVGRTAMCNFTPSDGSAAITFADIIDGDETNNIAGTNWLNLDFDGQATADSVSIAISSHVTVDGFSTSGHGNYITASDSVTLRNMDLCCTPNNTKLLLIDLFRGASSNITIGPGAIHTQTQTNDADHFECIYANAVQGLTVTGVLFYGCKSTGAMLVTCSGCSVQPNNFILENSIFEDSGSSTGETNGSSEGALSFQDPTITYPFSGCIIRNNMWAGSTPPDIGNAGVGSGCTLSNNIGAKPTCSTHTFVGNTWRSGTCTGDNSAVSTITNSTNFPNQATHNYVPSGSWAGCNLGSAVAGRFSALDRAGITRPVSTAPDLGPYEVC